MYAGMIEGAQSDRDRPEGTKGNYWNRNILLKFILFGFISAFIIIIVFYSLISPYRVAERYENDKENSINNLFQFFILNENKEDFTVNKILTSVTEAGSQ